MLFSPFLTAFLLLSSFVFFLELLHIPNALPIWFLEQTTHLWIWFLQKSCQPWLIGCASPSLLFLLLIIATAFLTIRSKEIKTIQKRIFYLAILRIGTCIMLKFFPYHYPAIGKIPCNKGNITIINTNNTITLIDPDFIASKPSYEPLISYTIIPVLIKTTGSMTIDHLILYKINQRVFDAIAFLGTKVTIKNVYVPWWTGRIPQCAWKSYVKLKKIVSYSGGKVNSVSKYRLIFKTKTSTLFIEPRATKNIHYHSATYPSLWVGGSINKQKIEL